MYIYIRYPIIYLYLLLSILSIYYLSKVILSILSIQWCSRSKGLRS